MLKLGTAAVIAVILSVGLWLGAESHYRGCIDAAVAATPAPERERSTQEDLEAVLNGEPGVPDTSREEAVGDCSRLPF